MVGLAGARGASTFLLSKALPLDAAAFAELAAKGSLAEHLPAFYAAARLLSFPDLEKHPTDSGKNGITFAQQANRWVELGKFFRESMLKKGTVMAMPKLRDKMPERSFLPCTISSNLPFSTSKLVELKRIFHAQDNSSMEAMMAYGLEVCEWAPSVGETKQCVGSIEDMIDFTTSILGRNVAARSTKSTAGSRHDVMAGKVEGINGGRLTQSVSCHQILFPYLLYYRHSVPQVRIYEADLLDPKTKEKIDHGVAIFHIDTSEWSANHGAFLVLGSRQRSDRCLSLDLRE